MTARRFARVIAHPTRLPVFCLRSQIMREGKRRRLIRRTIEAETIARYLLFTYFSNRALWPHLRSRAAVDALWTRSAPELRLAFGEGIPMRAVAAAINWNDPNSRR